MEQLRLVINEDQKEAIASIINQDSTIDLGIQAKNIDSGWILGDMYYFWYKIYGTNYNYPMSMNRYNIAASQLGLGNIFLRSILKEEAEVLTQYAGVWIQTKDIIGKVYLQDKIEYKVKITWSRRPVTVRISLREFKERLATVKLVDRQSIIKEMESQLI